MTTRMIYLPARRSKLQEGPFLEALQELGELKIHENARELDDAAVLAELRQADVIITMWGARKIPPALADDPGRVRYILHLTGTCRQYIPLEVIQSDILVTNWGIAPANCIAEGAMALLLAAMKDLRGRTEQIEAGKWQGARQMGLPSGTLKETKTGMYGCGAIGCRFVEMIRPFAPELSIFDPYADSLPEGCRQVDSLDALFGNSEILVILAGLNDETCDSVNAERLAMLPDHAIVINVARGEIVDQDALFAELQSGRLRAGLDVLAGNDSLPPDHEARTWTNLLLSCHDINSALWPPRPTSLSDADQIAIDNLKRFQRGEPLRFLMDEKRYQLST